MRWKDNGVCSLKRGAKRRTDRVMTFLGPVEGGAGWCISVAAGTGVKAYLGRATLRTRLDFALQKCDDFSLQASETHT